MHELSLASSLLDIVHGYSLEHKFKKVNSIKLSFGELSGVNKDSLTFAFKALAKGTIAEGADLMFTLIPAVATCCACRRNFQPPGDIAECPSCGSQEMYLSAGFDELKLLELDVE